jgi:hypothetical protein
MLRSATGSGTPRQRAGDFVTPKKRARSRSGGRRKSSRPSPSQMREGKRLAETITPEARRKAGLTNSVNSLRNNLAEQSRVAKDERWGTRGVFARAASRLCMWRSLFERSERASHVSRCRVQLRI